MLSHGPQPQDLLHGGLEEDRLHKYTRGKARAHHSHRQEKGNKHKDEERDREREREREG